MEAASVIGEPIRVDVGILLAGESNYVCLPLERLGVSRKDSVASIESSCPCVQPRLLSVLTHSGPAGAVRIDLQPESTSDVVDTEAHQLAVELSLNLASGAKRVVVLEFVETRTTGASDELSAAHRQIAIGRSP